MIFINFPITIYVKLWSPTVDTIFYIPRRHLRKRKSWAIIGLFYVPLEFQPKIKHWIYRHSIATGFLNYKVSLQTALYCWVCQMLHETSFQIINMYISGQIRASELLWH